ncbi:hypothetical protein [Nocardia sp. NPDC051981]|uniref:hypothetical protein n=1 Tax=Nocardia sp. NPDC051981 TaxID=3155417 RepID=UPI00342C1B1F
MAALGILGVHLGFRTRVEIGGGSMPRKGAASIATIWVSSLPKECSTTAGLHHASFPMMSAT